MCKQKCLCIAAIFLYPLAIASVLCNLLLLFPGWSYVYLLDHNITQEVYYMGGLVAGLTVLIPDIFLRLSERWLCCNNQCCKVVFALVLEIVGVCGAAYSFIVALFGMMNGPYCLYYGSWVTPFTYRSESYLFRKDWWGWCTEPNNIVEFNVALFSTLMVISGMKIVLCVSRVISVMIACLCCLPLTLSATKP
ncbi:transmembrane 4 L6 family member 4-like [Hoplias malabaricus]|uniref:transmembrane 4 L6 family member 4-like n=1 Tax=Hoplias malabaricus TaxID=27720 RepID=UPI00346276A8